MEHQAIEEEEKLQNHGFLKNEKGKRIELLDSRRLEVKVQEAPERLKERIEKVIII